MSDTQGAPTSRFFLIRILIEAMSYIKKLICADKNHVTYCQACRKNSMVRIANRYDGWDKVTIYACPECYHTFEIAEDQGNINPSNKHKELIEILKKDHNVKFDDEKPIATMTRNSSRTGFTRDY